MRSIYIYRNVLALSINGGIDFFREDLIVIECGGMRVIREIY